MNILWILWMDICYVHDKNHRLIMLFRQDRTSTKTSKLVWNNNGKEMAKKLWSASNYNQIHTLVQKLACKKSYFVYNTKTKSQPTVSTCKKREFETLFSTRFKFSQTKMSRRTFSCKKNQFAFHCFPSSITF